MDDLEELLTKFRKKVPDPKFDISKIKLGIEEFEIDEYEDNNGESLTMKYNCKKDSSSKDCAFCQTGLSHSLFMEGYIGWHGVTWDINDVAYIMEELEKIDWNLFENNNTVVVEGNGPMHIVQLMHATISITDDG